MTFIKDIDTAIKSLSSVFQLLKLLGDLFQSGSLRIELLNPEYSDTTEEGGSLKITLNSNSIIMDSKGNVSLLCPSSVSIKSRLIFLVSEEDPNSMDSFIAASIESDRTGSFQQYSDQEQIKSL